MPVAATVIANQKPLSLAKSALQKRTQVLQREIVIRKPETNEEFAQMYALRYRVYTESGITVAPYVDKEGRKLDRDIYDQKSEHWIAMAGSAMVGTIRAIPYDKNLPFITERLFEITWPKGVNPKDCAEASRAAVLPEYSSQGAVFQALLTAQYFWLQEQGVKWWIASLKRVLRDHLTKHCGLNIQELSGEVQQNCELYPDYLLNAKNGVGSIILDIERALPLFQTLKIQLPQGLSFR